MNDGEFVKYYKPEINPQEINIRSVMAFCEVDRGR